MLFMQSLVSFERVREFLEGGGKLSGMSPVSEPTHLEQESEPIACDDYEDEINASVEVSERSPLLASKQQSGLNKQTRIIFKSSQGQLRNSGNSRLGLSKFHAVFHGCPVPAHEMGTFSNGDVSPTLAPSPTSFLGGFSLRNLDLEIMRNGLTVICGVTGSGKSALCLALLGGVFDLCLLS
jgi:ABC-type multidrug transport system fused ATPase/permease subunit